VQRSRSTLPAVLISCPVISISLHLSRGKQFAEDTDVKQAVTPFLQTLDTHFSYAMIIIQAFVPRRDTRFSANDEHVEVWCAPSATHAPCTHRSQNVVGFRVLFILLSDTPS
jgi:hypothetical protein